MRNYERYGFCEGGRYENNDEGNDKKVQQLIRLLDKRIAHEISASAAGEERKMYNLKNIFYGEPNTPGRYECVREINFNYFPWPNGCRIWRREQPEDTPFCPVCVIFYIVYGGYASVYHEHI